jgi:hypothetical protein
VEWGGDACIAPCREMLTYRYDCIFVSDTSMVLELVFENRAFYTNL